MPDSPISTGDTRKIIGHTPDGQPIYGEPMIPFAAHLPQRVAASVAEDIAKVTEKIPVELRTDEEWKAMRDKSNEEIDIALNAKAIERAGFGPRFAKGGYVHTPAAARIHTPFGMTPPVILGDEQTMPDTRDNAARIIGLGGYQEHGKDAVADILVKYQGFKKFGMSDPINDVLMVLDPFIPSGDGWLTYSQFVALHGYVEAKKNTEVRRLLRTLGTEVGREMIDSDIWVNMAADKIQAELRNGNRVALTGIRNGGNEIGLIRALGGTLIWVERPGHPVPNTDHKSENSLTADDFDLTLMNDGTLTDLERTVLVTLHALTAWERRRAAQTRG